MVIDEGSVIPVCTRDVARQHHRRHHARPSLPLNDLQSRFGVRRVCLVADAGMISKKHESAAVEARGW